MNVPRILIVDDEDDIREMYRMILRQYQPEDKVIDDKEARPSFQLSSFSDSDEIEMFFRDKEPEIEVEDELKTGLYSLTEASQGEEAVEIVKQSLQENNPFSLMFIDIQMPPGMDGIQAAKEVRRLDKNIQIVIMTAYADYSYEEIVRTIQSEKRLLHFQKPFDAPQIRQLALSLTQHWLLNKVSDEQDK